MDLNPFSMEASGMQIVDDEEEGGREKEEGREEWVLSALEGVKESNRRCALSRCRRVGPSSASATKGVKEEE